MTNINGRTKRKHAQPNTVNAPVLFVGVGGIGSKIVKGIAERCINDDTDKLRFVVLDTDANSILKVNKGPHIIDIQTSSTSTVDDYLENDRDAKENWFPVNKMLGGKTVSEGAGQVRAISRLALDATIKLGRIVKLYRAIDELFLKDGDEHNQAIRVIIASTAAGGTGSGIAMQLGMLIRSYVDKNYPEAAAVIRGFIVMPGVMDTVIETQSEKDSQRCNGYATIKEINAFMMKGSGFCDIDPNLMRYKDLHVTVPTTSGGTEKLSNLPFDFCFLLDRTDSNDGNMKTLDQYIDYAAQSLYEQNVGAVSPEAASVEDNILKLFINPDTQGRCRFGGTGAAILRYPYEDIRDYLALTWTRSDIIGSSADESLSEEDRKNLLMSSWLQYDMDYKEKRRNWDESPMTAGGEEPVLSKCYINAVERGRMESSGNGFTYNLWNKYIEPKIASLPIELNAGKTPEGIAEQYWNRLIDEAINTHLAAKSIVLKPANMEAARTKLKDKGHAKAKFNQIKSLMEESRSKTTTEIVRNFAAGVFSSKSVIEDPRLGEYMIEKFLSHNSNPLHPNAMRYLLYVLRDFLEKKSADSKSGADVIVFDKQIDIMLNGKAYQDGSRDTSSFSIGRKKCNTLSEMSNECSNSGSDDDVRRCEKNLAAFYATVNNFFISTVGAAICEVAIPAVDQLIRAFEKFYSTFEGKTIGIEKKKREIEDKLKFNKGDCVVNVMGAKKLLKKLAKEVKQPKDSGANSATLYGEIFTAVRNNSYLELKRKLNPFDVEGEKDVFKDVIIEYYKTLVETTGSTFAVPNIMKALELEFNMSVLLELEKYVDASAEEFENKKEELRKDAAKAKYIADRIEMCKNLASPGIKKKDHDEPREVEKVGCNARIPKSDLGDYMNHLVKSESVSPYELRFYRAVYNISPNQISKLCAPAEKDIDDEYINDGENEYENTEAGDYFRVFQKYMDKIGPDCRRSAVITPHIDMRWNSISAMPELDMKYQERLMRKIHKSLIYGFIYDRIHLTATSESELERKRYQYRTASGNNLLDLRVSNKTKCDELYEVLDALYNDRLAVSVIREYVSALRKKAADRGYQTSSELRFFKNLEGFKFKKFTNDPEMSKVTDNASILAIVLMYGGSLPANQRNLNEIKVMTEAVIDILHKEYQLCMTDPDAIRIRVAQTLAEQFNMLLESYNKYERLRYGKFAVSVMDAIQDTIWNFMSEHDLDDYRDDMEVFED